MSTHNICFHGEIRIIFLGYPLLSRAMFLEATFCLSYRFYFISPYTVHMQKRLNRHMLVHVLLTLKLAYIKHRKTVVRRHSFFA